MTELTCAARVNGTSAASILARAAGSPSGAAESMARVRLSPEACGKCLSSRDWPGSLPPKLSFAGAPKAVH